MPGFFSSAPASAQVNAEQVLLIGRNVLSMQDYMLAIQYFNAAAKAKPYLADPYFFRALAKIQLEDYRGAVEDCTLALERNKFKVEAYKLRGFALQSLGQDSLAVIDFNEGLRHNPIDQYFLFYKGVAETELGRFSDSHETFDRLMRQYPRFAEGMSARAHLHAAEGDTLAALHDVEAAIEMNRTLLNPRLQRAELNARRGEWEAAIADMDEALRLKPDDASFHINRAYLRYNNDDYYGAMTDYNDALALDPGNRAALFNRALLRLEVRDLIHADEDLTEVLESDPDNFHARYNRGIARLGMEQYREAEKDFRVIAQRYPKFYPVYYALAQCEQGSGNMHRAVMMAKHGDDLVRNYVDDPTRHSLDRPAIDPGRSNDLSNQPHGKGDPDSDEDTELMERFNRLVTVGASPGQELSYDDKIKGRVQDRGVSAQAELPFIPTFVQPDRQLRPRSDRSPEIDEYNAGGFGNGRTLNLVSGTGAVSDSIGFNDARELAESLTPAADRPDARPVDMLTRGTAHAMLRNYPAALADLDAAVTASPRYTLAWLARGAARFLSARTDMEGRFEAATPEEAAMRRRAAVTLMAQATADFEKAAQLNPRLAYAWYNLGCALYAQDDMEKASEAFSKALNIDPDMGQAYFNRALCAIRAGHRDRASSDLGKAGELGIPGAYPLLKTIGN